MPEIVIPIPPKGVTKPDAVLTDLDVHRILTGQMIPNANAIHALAKEVAKVRNLE